MPNISRSLTSFKKYQERLRTLTPGTAEYTSIERMLHIREKELLSMGVDPYDTSKAVVFKPQSTSNSSKEEPNEETNSQVPEPQSPTSVLTEEEYELVKQSLQDYASNGYFIRAIARFHLQSDDARDIAQSLCLAWLNNPLSYFKALTNGYTSQYILASIRNQVCKRRNGIKLVSIEDIDYEHLSY